MSCAISDTSGTSPTGSVHIAGTKGKGSTATMAASILRESGWRVGLYTSPHLDRVEERMCINGQPCAQNEFVNLMLQMQRAVNELDRHYSADGSIGLTFFEIITALAFLHFAKSHVDIAVVEVGLGGRLDSTNVCEPIVSVITSISYDHMTQLGSTLSSIATEKAGIIKRRVPVVTGVSSITRDCSGSSNG